MARGDGHAAPPVTGGGEHAGARPMRRRPVTSRPRTRAARSGVAASLVLHAAAAAAARFLDLARRARDTPARSRSELLAELLMSESAISEDLLERARQLGIPVSGWHLVVRVEADDLDEAEQDEVRRFELLESAGQAALQAVTGVRRDAGTCPGSRVPSS